MPIHSDLDSLVHVEDKMRCNFTGYTKKRVCVRAFLWDPFTIGQACPTVCTCSNGVAWGKSTSRSCTLYIWLPCALTYQVIVGSGCSFFFGVLTFRFFGFFTIASHMKYVLLFFCACSSWTYVQEKMEVQNVYIL